MNKADHGILENLLNSYSVNGIISVFEEIDQKITSLQKCAHDDFYNLNDFFKKYFTDSKKLTKNALDFFESFYNNQAVVNINDIQEIADKNKHTFNRLIEIVDHSVDDLGRISQDIDNLFLPVNNFRQDLMTLKLLATNLKIDNVADLNKNRPDEQSKITDLISTLEHVSSIFPDIGSKIKEIKEITEHSITDLKKNVQVKLHTFIKKTDEFNLIVNKILVKLKDAKNKTPKLTAKTKEISGYIEQIITNLQYQDIIKQRIEHIQQTHQEIISKLVTLENDNKKVNIHDQAKIFLQIRDIAGLQAAQLIHVNKVYQKALEVITQMFNELGRNIATIANVCSDFFIASADFKEKNLNQTIDNLHIFGDSFSQINNISGHVNNVHAKIHRNFQYLEKFHIETQKIIRKINDTFQPVINIQNENTGVNPSTLSKIQNLKLELSELSGKIKLIISNSTKLTSKWANNRDIEKIRTSIDDISKIQQHKINNVIDFFDPFLKTSIKEVLKNVSDSKELIKEIKKSSGTIKYYDYFEGVINVIIDDLNTINFKLENDLNESGLDKSDNLEHIKKRYTMESEHEIHRQISEMKQMNEEIFSDEADKETEDDDDNLELF